MRPRPISRLIRINRGTHSQTNINKHLTIVPCRRFLHQKRLTPREIDKEAEENFTLQATSQSARDLIHSPQRDVYSYDKKPSVKFATPALTSLHARIGLPSAFPLNTLRRCLTDPSTEDDHAKHNEALSVLGSGLLEYYVSEYLCVRWPRLPMRTQLAALWAYTGESALARIAREWGLQSQSTRDPDKGQTIRQPADVDPRLLVRPPTTKEEREQAARNSRREWEAREQARQGWVEDPDIQVDKREYEKKFVLLALQRFVQSLVGGLYVHTVFSPLSNTLMIGHPLYSKLCKCTFSLTDSSATVNASYTCITSTRSHSSM